MKEDFKKWLCNKADYYYLKENYNIISLEILIKAMWAINREGKWNCRIDNEKITVCIGVVLETILVYKAFNDSEQETLTKALEYIYEKELKKVGI